jgi:hypothetical protein
LYLFANYLFAHWHVTPAKANREKTQSFSFLNSFLMKGKCSKGEGKKKIWPSLRRHYPDQVHGCDLSHPAFGGTAPRGLISPQM